MESLYRKYRPQTFADVVGQSHVVTTLERAVLEGRTSHAYLFCGPRGTGKTTMARLLAKALMCERGRQQLPDGTCGQCRQIAAGEHPDVYELDAASRTGVDNVREEIINRVGYAPVQAPVKLYIIDEVHMLTTAAFNALLKTLEEPPEHVVFVLCTTDPQKIPQTILSRVQRFDFRPISDADIEQRLAYVCEQEGFTYEQEALRIVSVNARGGMRDALSSLEQLSVFGGGTLSVQAARDLLGSLPEAELDRLVDAMAKRDAGTVFTEVQSLSDGGADLLRIVGDLAVRMRDVYVAAVAGKKAATAVARSCDAERLAHDAEAFGTSERIARALGVLSDVSREMATAPDQRLCFEIALTRILRPEVDLTMEALSERVAELEARLARLESTGVAHAAVAVAASPQVASTPSEKTHETGRQKDVPAREDERAPLTDEAPSPRGATPATRNDASAHEAPAHEAPARTVAAAPVPDVPKDMGGAQHGGPTSDARAGRHGKAGDFRTVAGDAAAAPVQAAPKASQAGSAAVTDAGALQRMWKQVSSTMFNRYPARGSLLANARAVSDDGEVLVARLPHGSSFSLRMLDRADVRTLVDNCVRDVFGPRVVRFEEGPAPAAGQGGAGGARMPVQATQQRHAQTASAAAPVAERSAQPLPWDEPAVPAGESMAAGYDEQGPFGDPGDGYLDGYLPFEAQEDLGGGAAVPKEGPAARQAPAASEPAGKEPAKESGATSDKAQPQESEAAQAVTKALADPELTDLPPDLIALLEDAFEVFGSDMQVKLPR